MTTPGELDSALTLLARWKTRQQDVSSIDLDIDRASLDIQLSLADIEANEILDAVSLGYRVDLVLKDQGLRCRVAAPPHGAIEIVSEHDPSYVFEKQELTAFDHAVDAGDLATILSLCRRGRVEGRVAVEHDARASGFHWVASTSWLLDELQSTAWVSVVARLFPDDAPSRLIVSDAPSLTVDARGLLITGPEGRDTDKTPDAGVWTHELLAYRATAHTDGRLQLPPPTALEVNDAQGDAEDLVHVLNGVACCLTWYSLAAEVRNSRTVRFDGAVSPK